MKLAAVSVDLDEIPNYFAIHGLPDPAGRGATAVYDVALGRLHALFRPLGVPLTLFCIGSDLSRPASANAVRAMVERGDEVANHTLDHLYDLTRKDRAEMRRQVEGGVTAIERAVGVRPSGFRAPGYTVTDELFEVLSDAGVGYDSSVFPCPPYYFAKAGVIGAMRLRGRRSRSVLDTPRVLLAPSRPYRIGRPYWTSGNGLLELPIQVTPGLRLPFFGTTVTAGGARGAAWLSRLVARSSFVNLELHGIDVLDQDDALESLAPHQPDVRVPHARKLEALAVVVEVLQRAGFAFVRLDEAARELAKTV